jgi:hypothetical protein
VLLNGLRIGFWHTNALLLLEVLRVVCQSYGLASMGGNSGVVFGRFTIDFCRALVVTTLCQLELGLK